MRTMLVRCLVAGAIALGAQVTIAPGLAHAMVAPAALGQVPDELVQPVQYYGERRFYGGPRYYGRPRYGYYGGPRFYRPGPRYYARRGYYGGPRYYGRGPGYYGRGYYR